MSEGTVGGAVPERWAAPSTFHGRGALSRRRMGASAPRLTDKKKTMRTIAKLAHLGTTGGRFPLSDVFDHLRRALNAKADRRPSRPLQDIDGWSDQAEVAYYEGCRASRCL